MNMASRSDLTEVAAHDRAPGIRQRHRLRVLRRPHLHTETLTLNQSVKGLSGTVPSRLQGAPLMFWVAAREAKRA